MHSCRVRWLDGCNNAGTMQSTRWTFRIKIGRKIQSFYNERVMKRAS